MRFVDLSHPLATGMPVYPGDPAVTIAPALTVAADGVAVARLDLGSHAGTHLDAPVHVIPGGRTVEEIPLALLWGEAFVARIAAATPGAAITAADVSILPAKLPQIVCIDTGWDAHFGTAVAHAHPYLAQEFAEELWARGARVLCVDTLSPDAMGEESLPVHQFWLGNDGVIVENLRGLSEIPDSVELSVLPLKLDGVDGSPVRAIARFAGE